VPWKIAEKNPASGSVTSHDVTSDKYYISIVNERLQYQGQPLSGRPLVFHAPAGSRLLHASPELLAARVRVGSGVLEDWLQAGLRAGGRVRR
jgi:hypothetical protein